ncbi:multifunctional methyltransferase subunit [Acrasis kona]|uniref:Multifunctional methyltransferase subunit n=1 Tax=Acrasis kona TaxID=1008807 RepID=A0AAW2Z1X5_9EUKA
MRILTHNMLCCLKCDSFPLKIVAVNKEQDEQDENPEFIKHMLDRLDYDALKSAAKDLSIEGLPDALPENVAENQAALTSLHKLLLEVVVKDGELQCTNPACNRSYPIKQGIPNMVLREDEVKIKAV